MSELRLYDRSRVVTDWSCPRKRWWQYEYDGKGIVSGNTHLELFLGTCLHDGLAAIAHQHLSDTVDIDAVSAAARKQMIDALLAQTTGEVDEVNFANEQAALVEGLLRGFHKHVWPRLMTQYPVIMCIEQEMTYEHDALVFMAKPDLVLADTEGNIWYIEYKSTSSKKEGWLNSWNTAVQLHSSIRAIESTIHEKVSGVIVVGLYKGFESYGKQSSPMCYSYKRNGNPPFSQDEVMYEYKAGFKRYPTWEMPGGVKAWVEGMPANILADQYPQTPPIFVKDDLVDKFFQQRSYREKEIQHALKMIVNADDPEWGKQLLEVAFPQKFDQCQPGWGKWGKSCQYLKICHGHVENPLLEGFEWRVPHHKPELEQWEQQEQQNG